MALATGGFSTYDAIGNREDLTDVIYDISPTDTPYMNNIGRTTATATLHEWQTDDLASATADNATLEGNVSVVETSSPTTRPNNYAQILEKTASVTGTQERVNKAGRSSEMAYQMAKRSKELKRDLESSLLANKGMNAGSTTVARVMRGVPSWLTTNVSFNSTDGANSTGAAYARTDGTQRAYTEDLLATVIQSCWENGGEPNIIMTGAYNKRINSTFTGRSQARQPVEATKIQANADMYASDFGDFRIIANRFQRPRDVHVCDPRMAAVSYLRPFTRHPLAKRGDSEERLINVEATLEMRNEKAHGLVADLTDSA